MSSESDNVSPSLNIEKCALIIVDVAGTTTSINFVKDTLFPYALKHAESFLQSKWDEDAVKECVKELKESEDAELDVAGAVELVKSLSEKNSDNKGLKTLQGLIYQQGYEKGELKAHVFDEVPGAFENWAKARNVAIYSTGSIESQRLLFKHTTSGDISGHIFKYFDQSIGAKTEGESYKKIAKEFQLEPEEVIFVTDSVEEAKAAKSVGVTAVLIKRDGNEAIADEVSKEFKVISSFTELGLENASKRKIEESTATDEAPPAKVAKTETSEDAKVDEEKPKAETMEVDTPVEEKATEPEQKEKPAEETKETETVKSAEMTEPKEKAPETETETLEKAAPKEDEEMKPVEEKPAETEEEKVEAAEEAKEASAEEKTEPTLEEKPTNGDVKENASEEKVATVAEEKSDEAEPKTEEKENKSVLANGAENGNGKVDSDDKDEKESETSDKDEVKVDKTEVIVKKLEESTESKTVSVEV